MNLLELATGAKSSEYKVVVIIIFILGCQVLGIDAAAILPFVLDGGDVIKYEELIKAMGRTGSAPSGAAMWALAAVGVGYPATRAYVKKLKADVIKETAT
jgi:hypothetical protein